MEKKKGFAGDISICRRFKQQPRTSRISLETTPLFQSIDHNKLALIGYYACAVGLDRSLHSI